MATISKKDIIDRIADTHQVKRILVKKVVQSFLNEIIDELAKDNRLEFRDFGVFKTIKRPSRTAQNPKTMEKVQVEAKRKVKFKVGKLMKQKIAEDNSEQHM